MDMTDVPVAAALLLGYTEGARTVGIAFADAAGRRLGACEFADDEYFCSTEAVLLQLGAKEVVLPKVLIRHTHTAHCLARCVMSPAWRVMHVASNRKSFKPSCCASFKMKSM